MTVERVRMLRLAGDHEAHLPAALAQIVTTPEDARAHVEVAYGYDRAGRERDAILHYERAHALGVSGEERRRFLVGFGSTLRNVGRADDAVALLAQAVAEDPDYPAFAAFLALALLSAGHAKAAIAAMLGAALDAARAGAFDGYERALGEYHRELLLGG